MVEKTVPAAAPTERDTLAFQLEMARKGIIVRPDGCMVFSPMQRNPDPGLVGRLSARLAELEAIAA